MRPLVDFLAALAVLVVVVGVVPGEVPAEGGEDVGPGRGLPLLHVPPGDGGVEPVLEHALVVERLAIPES